MKVCITLCFIGFLLALCAELNALKFKNEKEWKFAVKLYKSLRKLKADYRIYSPTSLRRSIAILRIGASTTTSTQIKNAAELKRGDNTDVAKEIGAFRKSNTLYKASMWYSKQHSVYYLFRNRLTNNFGYKRSIVKRFNVKDINTWIEMNTIKTMNNFIESKELDDSTMQCFAETININAGWQKPLEEMGMLPFYNVSASSYNVASYKLQMKLLYGELSPNDLDATAVVLPLKGNLKMLILLPNKRNGLNRLEENLAKLDIRKLPSLLKEQVVLLYMPKLSIRVEEKIQKVIQDLGITDAFTKKANFTHLTYSRTPDVLVEKIQHASALELNAKGVEATAVTTIQMASKSGRNKQIGELKETNSMPTRNNDKVLATNKERIKNKDIDRYMDVDHPFFYALMSDRNILFAGGIRNV